MKGKVKLAIQDLSYCGGCEVALADMGNVLLDLLDEQVELVYAPLLMSAEDFDDVDILMVTGAARTEEDIANLKRGREHARYLVSFGTCATFGGLPGLANMKDDTELIDVAYGKTSEDGQQKVIHPNDVPVLTAKVQPISAYVSVDFCVTGCPPPPYILADFLKRALKKLSLEEVSS